MTDADLVKFQAFVLDASGRDDWKGDAEFWMPVKAILAKHRLTLEGAKNTTLAAWKRFGNSPSQLYRGLATVLDEGKQPNLPAATNAAPCDLCGYQGLVQIERRDGQPFEELIGREYRMVRRRTVTCTCQEGQRIEAAHGAEPKWRRLANADRSCWQPLGGWPGEEAPRLAVVGADDEDETIPF